MDESQYHEEMQALREELATLRRGELHVVTDEEGRPRRVTNTEVLRVLLDRLYQSAHPATNTVTITRNAKHETQFSVDARGETVAEAMAEAVKAHEALSVLFPPVSAEPVRKPTRAASDAGKE